jgi:hypothetical protein
MNSDMIVKLIEKAAEAEDAGDAMRFSQAASNAAHALTLCRDNSIEPSEPSK